MSSSSQMKWYTRKVKQQFRHRPLATHDEIDQGDRELFARSEHQELVDKERHRELKDMYNQEK
eukprot:8752718-Prorocentrum_lima.AAC.1